MLKKNRQHNDQRRTNNDLQNSTQKVKDWATCTPLKTGVNSCTPEGYFVSSSNIVYNYFFRIYSSLFLSKRQLFYYQEMTDIDSQKLLPTQHITYDIILNINTISILIPMKSKTSWKVNSPPPPLQRKTIRFIIFVNGFRYAVAVVFNTGLI